MGQCAEVRQTAALATGRAPQGTALVCWIACARKHVHVAAPCRLRLRRMRSSIWHACASSTCIAWNATGTARLPTARPEHMSHLYTRAYSPHVSALLAYCLPAFGSAQQDILQWRGDPGACRVQGCAVVAGTHQAATRSAEGHNRDAILGAEQ